jgi:acetyl esterase/lipase
VNDQPEYLQPFLLDVPEQERERAGQVDLYLPGPAQPGPAQPRPAIVFIHGGPIPAGRQPTPRDWPAYVGYGRYAASQGAVGVTVDHRLHSLADYPLAASDIAAAVEAVRADPRVDAGRIALWFFSGGGLLSAAWLAVPPAWLRCVAMTYPVLSPLPKWEQVDARFRPAQAVAGAGRLPIVLTRVGRERPAIAATVTEFLAAARESGAALEVIDVPGGHHGFETIDHTEQARDAVRSAVQTVLTHLHSS